MGFNKSLLAFDDVREIYQQAIDSESGIRVKFTSNGRALAARHRFNSYRKADRAENCKIYSEDHPMFGRSVYDRLILRIPKQGMEDDMYLYIEKRSANQFEIEPLTSKPDDEIDLGLEISS